MVSVFWIKQEEAAENQKHASFCSTGIMFIWIHFSSQHLTVAPRSLENAHHKMGIKERRLFMKP
jgi:hypothetical protein